MQDITKINQMHLWKSCSMVIAEVQNAICAAECNVASPLDEMFYLMTSVPAVAAMELSFLLVLMKVKTAYLG